MFWILNNFIAKLCQIFKQKKIISDFIKIEKERHSNSVSITYSDIAKVYEVEIRAKLLCKYKCENSYQTISKWNKSKTNEPILSIAGVAFNDQRNDHFDRVKQKNFVIILRYLHLFKINNIIRLWKIKTKLSANGEQKREKARVSIIFNGSLPLKRATMTSISKTYLPYITRGHSHCNKARKNKSSVKAILFHKGHNYLTTLYKTD